MGKKLLVADDSLTIQKVIKLALSGDVYDIQTVSDGNDALQQISVFHPDAVLIDVGIPGRSAFEVKKAMNEDSDFRNIPVILMSSAFEKVDEAKVALLQFEGRLTKPFDPTHLRQALTQALSLREAYNPPAPEREEPSLVFAKDPAPAPPRPQSSTPTPMPPGDAIARELAREPARKVEPPRPVLTSTGPATAKSTPAPAAREPARERDEDERTKTFNTYTNTSANPLALDLSQDLGSTFAQSSQASPSSSSPSSSLNLGGAFNGLPPEIELPELEPLTFGSNEESDIKHLTESTVRMSSLDEYDSWNIGEGAKGPASPSIDLGGSLSNTSAKPMDADSFLSANKLNFGFGDDPGGNDGGPNDILPPRFDHTRSIANIAPTRTDLEFTNQRLAAFTNEQLGAPAVALESNPANDFRSGSGGGSSPFGSGMPQFEVSGSSYGSIAADPEPSGNERREALNDRREATTDRREAITDRRDATVPATPQEPAPASRESVFAALNGEEMQARIAELVRAEVERTLEGMAKKGLPDIAEKVIRQEIRRILESLN